MSICQICGEEIEWRTIDGRAVPMHPNGGWECSGPREDAIRERTCWRTKCPRCGAAPVFFVRHNGGSVWFDDLGQPWPIHGCFAEDPACRSLSAIRLAAARIESGVVLGVVATSKILDNRVFIAVELFNGRKACFQVAEPPIALAVGTALAVFRESQKSAGTILTEQSIRVPILQFVSASVLGLPTNWADCERYEDIETSDEVMLLTYGELLRLLKENPKDFAELARVFNADDQKEEARQMFRRRHQYAGKIICAARAAWDEQRRLGIVTQTFPAYFEFLTGQRPSNRGQSCAKMYRTMVLNGKITEEDYDYHTCEAVGTASRVIYRVGDNLNHPAVAEAAAILRKRTRTTIRDLRALLARLREDTVSGRVVLLADERDDPAFSTISYAEAMQFAERIVAAGHYGAMTTALCDLSATTPDMQAADIIARGIGKIRAALKGNCDEEGRQRFSDAMIDDWMQPSRSLKIVTLESLKAEYTAALKQVGALGEKLKSAGVSLSNDGTLGGLGVEV